MPRFSADARDLRRALLLAVRACGDREDTEVELRIDAGIGRILSAEAKTGGRAEVRFPAAGDGREGLSWSLRLTAASFRDALRTGRGLVRGPVELVWEEDRPTLLRLQSEAEEERVLSCRPRLEKTEEKTGAAVSSLRLSPRTWERLAEFAGEAGVVGCRSQGDRAYAIRPDGSVLEIGSLPAQGRVSPEILLSGKDAALLAWALKGAQGPSGSLEEVRISSPDPQGHREVHTSHFTAAFPSVFRTTFLRDLPPDYRAQNEPLLSDLVQADLFASGHIPLQPTSSLPHDEALPPPAEAAPVVEEMTLFGEVVQRKVVSPQAPLRKAKPKSKRATPSIIPEWAKESWGEREARIGAYLVRPLSPLRIQRERTGGALRVDRKALTQAVREGMRSATVQSLQTPQASEARLKLAPNGTGKMGVWIVLGKEEIPILTDIEMAEEGFPGDAPLASVQQALRIIRDLPRREQEVQIGSYERGDLYLRAVEAWMRLSARSTLGPIELQRPADEGLSARLSLSERLLAHLPSDHADPLVATLGLQGRFQVNEAEYAELSGVGVRNVVHRLRDNRRTLRAAEPPKPPKSRKRSG